MSDTTTTTTPKATNPLGAVVTARQIRDAIAATRLVSRPRSVGLVLAHTHLRIADGVVWARGTDLDTEIVYHVGSHTPADEMQQVEPLVLDTDALWKRLPRRKGDEVHFGRVELDGVMQIGNATYRIDGMDPADFPASQLAVETKLPTAVHWSARSADLRLAVEAALRTTTDESGRYAINGVLFEARGDGTAVDVVSTDGRRLTHTAVPVPVEWAGKRPADAQRFILPENAAKALIKLIAAGEDDCTSLRIAGPDAGARAYVQFAQDSVGPLSKTWSLVAAKLEGRFPDWRDVLPREKSFGVDVAVDAEPLLAAIEALIPVANSNPDGVAKVDVTVRGAVAKMTLSAKSESGHWSTADVDTLVGTTRNKSGNGQARFGVNLRYLQDAVVSAASSSGSVLLRFPPAGPKYSHKPCELQPGPATGGVLPITSVIMPKSLE